jgi:hypothetical protein
MSTDKPYLGYYGWNIHYIIGSEMGKLTYVAKYNTGEYYNPWCTSSADNFIIKKFSVNGIVHTTDTFHITYDISDSVNNVGYLGEDTEMCLMYKITTKTSIPEGYNVYWYADGKEYDQFNTNGGEGGLVDDHTFIGRQQNYGVNAYRFGHGYTCTPVLMDSDKNIIPCTIDLYIIKWMNNIDTNQIADQEYTIEYTIHEAIYNDLFKYVTAYPNSDFGNEIRLDFNVKSIIDFTPIYNETVYIS